MLNCPNYSEYTQMGHDIGGVIRHNPSAVGTGKPEHIMSGLGADLGGGSHLVQ